MTKILFLDNDEMAFQVRQCMAKVLRQLPPIEMFHATDATEALQLLENLQPDVVIVDDELSEERDLFLESLSSNHPPVVVQTDESSPKPSPKKQVTYIPKNESLEGIHRTLLVATTLATKLAAGGEQRMV